MNATTTNGRPRELPPHSYEAEAAVLGAMMIDAAAVVPIVAEHVTAGDFYGEKHAAIYDAIVSVHAERGSVDMVLLNERLRDAGMLEQVGGVDYLLDLANGTPHTANAAYYAGIVAEKSTRRRVVEFAEHTRRAAMEGGDVDHLAELVNRAGGRKPSTAADCLSGGALADYMERGLADGFGFNCYDVDFICDREDAPRENPIMIGPGLVSILGGPPGAGKSALWEQLTWECVESLGVRALIANVELSPAVLLARLLNRLTGVATLAILRGTMNPYQRGIVAEALAALRPVLERVAILRNPRTIGQVHAAAKEHEAEIVLVDYIQRLGSAGRAADARQEMNAVMADMRRLADEGRAVLAVSALSRSKGSSGSSYKGSTDIASFRESSEVEYGADWAAIIEPHEEDPRGRTLRIVKHRFGELGKYRAHFAGASMTWTIGGEE